MTHLTLSPSRYAALQAKAKGSTATRADEREGEGGRKRSKYRNKRVLIDGEVYASKREYARWLELRMMQSAGDISDLQRQVPFSLHVNGVHVCKYVADAVYTERGRRIVEDCKGMKTDVYKIKRALMRACYGIDIHET